MADTTQISATIKKPLNEYIAKEAKLEKRTKSQMIELLLEEGKLNRELMKQEHLIKSKKK